MTADVSSSFDQVSKGVINATGLRAQCRKKRRKRKSKGADTFLTYASARDQAVRLYGGV